MSLRLEHVTVGYYRDIMILEDVSVEAKENMITTIIGPNGAGKSTTLKTAYGFLHPVSGKVFLNNKEITKLSPFNMPKQGMAYIMQERGIFPYLSVEENLQLGAWLFKNDSRRVRDAINAVFEKYPILRERKKVPAGNLSGGEQRMLEMGKALMLNPDVILFDEPTAGLAPIAANVIFDEIKNLKESNRIIMMVEQNVKKALTITDYVYVLEMGKISFHGQKEKIDLREAVTPWINW